MRALVTSEKELADLVEKASGRILAFDTETTDLSKERIVVGFSFSFRDDSGNLVSYYAPLAHMIMPEVDEYGEVITDLQLKKLLSTPSPYNIRFEKYDLADLLRKLLTGATKLVMHNAKFDINTLRFRYGICFWEYATRIYDTLQMAWLENGSEVGVNSLEQCAARYLGEKKSFSPFIVSYKAKGKGKKAYKINVFPYSPIDECVKYAAGDTELTYKLFEVLSNALTSRKYVNAFNSIDSKLILVTSDMEARGIKIDAEELIKIAENISIECEDTYQRIGTLLGLTPNTKEYNKKSLNCQAWFDQYLFSPPGEYAPLPKTKSPNKKKKGYVPPTPEELAQKKAQKKAQEREYRKDFLVRNRRAHWVAFGERQFTSRGLGRGKEHISAWSSGKYKSTDIGKEIATLLYRYNALSKIRTTFSETFVTAMGKDGRLRTSFNDSGTKTGRYSSSEPNLMNLPTGRENNLTGHLPSVRSAFISESGYSFVGGDFSQIELRVLASMTSDPTMLYAYNNDIDLHTATAAAVFSIPIDQVTPTQRAAAKTINFGLIYGMGPKKLSETLGISLETAKAYTAAYFEKLPYVQPYFDDNFELCKKRGYAKTIFGRRRNFSELSLVNDFNAIRRKTQRGLNLTSDEYRLYKSILRSYDAYVEKAKDKDEEVQTLESFIKGRQASEKRQANNLPIQGSAADLIRRAMAQLYDALLEKGWIQDGTAYLVLQIHDELIMEVRDDRVPEALVMLKTCMENSCRDANGQSMLKVPLVTVPKAGKALNEIK